MAVETKQTLSAETVSQLQELIQINIDSRDGFRQASEALDDLTLRSAFEQLADDRDVQADDLARFVTWNGEIPRREGSVSASVHRTWMSIREMLSSDDRYAMLAEAERGEDAIKAAYETALKSTAGSAMNDVLLRQYAAVKASHDRIRDLRDACQDCA
ncbi:MAG: PA2169 family four-helix-bundle protein [Planctomycetaceae bacterium]|nr:PA2169 family four-helix-bundle protein [Planctomycetaceae bacterium]